MGVPFLEQDPDGFQDGERASAIIEDVELYLDWTNGEQVVVDSEVVTEYPTPPAYHWLLWCERWGLPLTGGWAEQPCFFMSDINAAKVARENFRVRQAINQRNKDAYG